MKISPVIERGLKFEVIIFEGNPLLPW